MGLTYIHCHERNKQLGEACWIVQGAQRSGDLDGWGRRVGERLKKVGMYVYT